MSSYIHSIVSPLTRSRISRSSDRVLTDISLRAEDLGFAMTERAEIRTEISALDENTVGNLRSADPVAIDKLSTNLEDANNPPFD